jgi:hypothetical protein
MEKNYADFSMQEAMRLAQSEAGQQLLQLLRSNHSDAARSALEKAQDGDLNQAKQALQAFLSDPKTQELLQKLKEGNHG